MVNHTRRWDPKSQHELMIAKYGYETAKFNRTFDCYDFVDCYNYMNLHDLLKYYKTGISKVTDHATREIRHGRLSKEEALDLVDHYQKFEPKYIDMFCDWLGTNKRSLQYILDMHRNKDIWELDNDRNWVFKKKSNLNKKNNFKSSIKFEANSSLSRNISNQYITIGKGYP